MWESRMYLDYDDLYIPLTSGKFQPQTILFLVKKAYCFVDQDFWKKKKIQFEILLTQASK